MERSNRDMFRQFEEQCEQVEVLTKENRVLRAENKKLNKKLSDWEERFERRIEEAVDRAVEKATKPLKAEIAMLKAENVKKDREISRLKSQIDKNSSNSSKPPSSDGLKKILNSREKSERKTGGQPQHKGHTIQIPKDLATQVANGKAEHIIRDETNGATSYVSDWLVDIKIKPVYMEIRRSIGKAPVIQYGKNIKAISVYLLHIGMLSLERLTAFISSATNELINISQGTLLSFCHSVAKNIDTSTYENELLNGLYMHVDETPIKTTQRVSDKKELETKEGSTYNAYIRTYSNATTTVLTANSHKNIQSVESDNMLSRYCGVLCHDHETKFYRYGEKHATCIAHLLRDLKGLIELQMIQWASKIKDFFQSMNRHKEKDINDGITQCDADALLNYAQMYDELVKQGENELEALKSTSFGYKSFRCMVNRLKEYKNAYMLFMNHYEIPATNNQAERDLRHAKTKQKVSGCYRSWTGLLDYCKIRSLADTAKKRGLNVLSAIRECCPAE